MTGKMEKLRPWCGQASDRGWLKNRTEHNYASVMYAVVVCPSVRPSVTSWYCMENNGMNRVGFWHRGSLIPIIHCIFKNPGTSKYFLLKLCYKDWTYKTFLPPQVTGMLTYTPFIDIIFDITCMRSSTIRCVRSQC